MKKSNFVSYANNFHVVLFRNKNNLQPFWASQFIIFVILCKREKGDVEKNDRVNIATINCENRRRDIERSSD